MSRNIGIFITSLFIGFVIAGCSKPLYLTPTAVPTVTSTSIDSNPCRGNIQASPPVVVRPKGVGGTERAETGHYAFNAQAASTSAGILVAWRTGVVARFPEPNNFVRLLDDNGQPIGNVSPPLERSGIRELSLVSKDDGALLTFCGIYDNGTYITSALLDPYGKLISEQRRFSTDGLLCTGPKATAIWSGSRLLFAWSSQFYPPDNEIRLEIADTNGKSLLEKKLVPYGASDPHFAVGHGHIFMVVTTRTDAGSIDTDNRGITHLVVQRFDMNGNALGELMVLDPPTFVNENGQSFVSALQFGSSFIIPVNDGWLLLASPSVKTSAYYIAHLAPDGSIISGPNLVNSNANIGFLDAIPYGGGVMALVDRGDGIAFSKIVFLSADGIITQEWSPSPNEYKGYFDEAMGIGGLVKHKGRLFVTYTTAPEGSPVTNEVLIRELECVP